MHPVSGARVLARNHLAINDERRGDHVGSDSRESGGPVETAARRQPSRTWVHMIAVELEFMTKRLASQAGVRCIAPV